jgi:2-iminoacetate synthase
MFSKEYDRVREAIIGESMSLSKEEAVSYVTRVVSHDPQIAKLFWAEGFGADGPLDHLIIETSRRIKEKAFHGSVFAVVPLYATSICAEQCLYCNYRAGNKGIGIERIRLSDTDLIAEANFLIEEKGLRAIELVYATDPLMRADSMCRHVELIQRLLERSGGGSVGINAEALDESEYRSLKNAGLSFAVLWQETYNRNRYREVHPGSTKKTNFEYRVNAYERMIAAGIRNIGMGVLSGLAGWKSDWAMLMSHESYLRRKYGVDIAILGIPRLKPAVGATLQHSEFTPTDQEFVVALALHNIYSPDTRPFVNTREDWNLCVRLAQGGGCMFTFNCSTVPGGYSLGKRGYQFPTYSYDAPAFSKELRERDLYVVYQWAFDKPFQTPQETLGSSRICTDNSLSMALS